MGKKRVIFPQAVSEKAKLLKEYFEKDPEVLMAPLWL